MPPTPTYSLATIAPPNDACKVPTKACTLPPGAKPLCYANSGTTNPKADQFCGFVQNGTLFAAQGCCTPACPNPRCPDVPPADPTGVIPDDVDLSDEIKAQSSGEPSSGAKLPKLALLLLITLSFLLVCALIAILAQV
jgi:hypothetical protein